MQFLSEKHNINAIILAGGKSKRMGFNKELITLHDKRLIDTQIETLKKVFKTIYVVSPNKHLYKDKDVVVIEDILESKGPLTGLHTGLYHSDTTYNYLIACDMPHIDLNFINHQIAKLEDKEAYVVKSTYYEPFHGFYNKSLVNKIETFFQTSQKFQVFIDTINVDISTNINPFIFYNINTPLDLYRLEKDEETYKEFQIEKHKDETVKIVSDAVIDEYPITLFINNEKYVTLLVTPKHIEELIVGYLRSEKIIDQYSDIKELNIQKSDHRVEVSLYNNLELETINKDKLLTSGCGVGTRFHEDIEQIITQTIESEYSITYDEILDASKELNNKSGLFKLTGGVHSALFITKGIHYYFEDIGRHNTIDKVVGYITINECQTNDSYIFASGRISSDMLIKCAVIGIPIVISRSAPTSLAVNLAEKYGITLIGFARGNTFNVYTHSFRIRR